jgi:hypothetical protein
MATTSLNGGSIFTALIPLYVTAPVAGTFKIGRLNVDDVFQVSVNGGAWDNYIVETKLYFSAGETKRIALWYQNTAWSGSYLDLQFSGESAASVSPWIYGSQDTSSFISIKCLPSSELLTLAGRLPNDLPSVPNTTTIGGFSGLIYYTRQNNGNGTTGAPPNLAPVGVGQNSALPADPSGYFTSSAINFWTDLRPFSRPSGTVEWPAITRVAKISQTITLASISSKAPNAVPFTVTATASSGLPVTLSVQSGSDVATISGNTITLTGQTGTVTIAANQSGDASYTAATQVTRSFTVAKLPQTITLASISSKAPNAVPFTVAGLASSGLPVTLSVKSGPATISGNTITLTGQTGTVVIAANQPGDDNYTAAIEVTRSFTVTKLSQTITLASISSKAPNAVPFTVAGLASSGLPVTLSVESGSDVATISGNTITLTGQTGQVTIAANQSGDANYTAATEVTTSFAVAKLSQSITLASISSKAPWEAPFAVTATSSSGLPVALSVKSGDAVAAISGNTITLTGKTGTVTIAANQSGGINHDAAPEVTRSFSVEFPVVATVRLRKNQFSITDPYNDVTLAGGNYRFARWKKEGTIPPGLNWEGNNEGLRFWGTPAVAGTFTATFEGPYLPNFFSSATVGSSGGNTVCGINGTKNGGILVTAFSIRFVVTEVIEQNPVIDGVQFFGPRTYGEALSGVLQGKLARRSEWGSDKRCIGSRPFTENISDSSSARNLTTPATDNFLIWNYTAPASRTAQDGASVYVLRNDQLEEDDITGADWVVSDSSGMTFPGESTLDTLNARRQIILPETPTDYATFNGDPFDGEKWRIIMDAEIPLSANSRSFGDFFLHEDFKGVIKINFWTSIDGRISNYPWASFGLKMFFGIMENGIAQYRNPDPGMTLGYDVASTSAEVFNSSLVTEGKRGVFNLTCAALPPNSSAKAHLKIIALK